VNLNELGKELSKGTLRPAYLLAGEEVLLRDDAMSEIQKAVLDGTADDFNHDRLSGEQTTPQALLDSVQSRPIMARRRLVVLSSPEGRRAGAKALLDALPQIVEDLKGQEETILVVTVGKADKRARWYKAFSDPAASISCDAPKTTREIVAFIDAEARQQGIEMESGVPELLAERVGPQLLMLRNELAKASLLAGLGEKLSRDHVGVSVAQVAEQSIWDLTDAIGDGRSAEALSLLARLLEGGAATPAVLGTLAGHFRKLARVRGGADVPGPPFVKKKLERQARRYTSSQLLRCLREIHYTDTALKGAGSLPPEMALERLVLGLAG
jgi:DNA polymerase-3 subunit delta